MDFKSFILLCSCFLLVTPAHGSLIEGRDEDIGEEKLAESYFELTPEFLEQIIEEEERQLKNLEKQHEYNTKNLPAVPVISKGHENSMKFVSLPYSSLK